MSEDEGQPPFRFLLAGLFMAARMVNRGAPAAEDREAFVQSSLADADELLRQEPT